MSREYVYVWIPCIKETMTIIIIIIVIIIIIIQSVPKFVKQN